MSAKNIATEVISAAGPHPISDAVKSLYDVTFSAAMSISCLIYLNDCAINDNETLHRVNDANDYPRDAFVNEASSAPVLFVEIEKDLLGREEIFGAGGSMAETN